MLRYHLFFGLSILLGLSFIFLSWNFAKMQQLQLEIDKLTDLLKTCESSSASKDVPSTEHELTRLKVRRDVNEFWSFVRAKFDRSLEEARNRTENKTVLLWDNALKSGRHRYNVIKRDLEILSGMGCTLLLLQFFQSLSNVFQKL